MNALKHTQHFVQQRIEQWHPMFMVVFVGLSAMMTYFSMYAFRKPFSVATYDSVESLFSALDYKTLIVISQVIGYAISKLIGIKLIAEMPAYKRIQTILIMMAFAQLSLVAFALIPAPWNVVAIFCNGLPLGLIWGLVFSFLEGRRVSEALGVILGISLIFSSGVVKSLGRYLLIEWDVSEFWMPATLGFLFSPFLLLSILALSCTPPPTEKDRLSRQKRVTMDNRSRFSFFNRYAIGIVLLVASYIIFTSLREFIDNFAPEIWTSLGYEKSSLVYTSTILPVTLVMMVLMLGLMFIKNNLLALHLNTLLALTGFAVIIACTWAWQQSMISGLVWMTLLQMGIYAGFMPFNCMLFDRLMAATPALGNAGFLMYIADSSGYLGSIGIMLYRALFDAELNWVDFVSQVSLVSSIIGFIFLLFSVVYFQRCLGQQAVSTKQSMEHSHA